MVHLLLPLLVLALVRALAWGSITAAAGAGLLLTAVLAAAPALVVPAVLALAVLAVLAVLGCRGASAAGRNDAPARLAGWRRLPLAALVLATPAALLLPWWIATFRHPRLLTADPALGWTAPLLKNAQDGSWWHLAAVPGSPQEVFAPPAAVLERVAGVVGGTGSGAGVVVGWLASPWTAQVLAVLVLAPVVAFAVVGLFRRRGAVLVAVAGWLVALIGLAAALAGERIVAGGGRVWPGPALSLTMAGLLAAAVTGGPVFTRRLRQVSRRRRWILAVPVALGLVVGPVMALTVFATQGARPAEAGDPRRVPADVLPAVSTAEARGRGAGRTLVLAVDRVAGAGLDGQPAQGDGAAADRVRWAIYRDAGPRFGTDSVARRLLAPDDAAVVLPVVAALLSDTAQDERGALADLAVGTIVALPPVDEAAEQALDAAVGLVRVDTGEERAIWRVEPAQDNRASSRPGRVRVVDANGAVTAVVSSSGPAYADRVRGEVAAGGPDRRLVLAERADPGWRASLDGVALEPVTVAGWAQGFELPRHAGRLVVAHRPEVAWIAQPWFGGAWLAAALLIALLALPLPRVRERIRPPPAPTPSRRVYRDAATVAGDLRAARPQVFDVDHPEEGDLPPVLHDDRPKGDQA